MIALGRVLADALVACHAEGVLHRDLSPGNVLLRAGSGQPLLTDFGLSKDLAAADPASIEARTLEGGVLGTPHYAPPEQLRGEVAAIGPRSEVWGLGAILYAALTGQPPRDAETQLELLAGSDRSIEAPSAHTRAIPPGLEQVIVRCLAPRLEDRYPEAAALRDDLDALLAGALGAASVALVGRREREPVEQAAPPPPSVEVPAPIGATPPPDPAPVRRDPAAARVAAQRALSAWQAKNQALALRELARALSADPDCVDALLLQATVRQEQADLGRALESVTRAIELAPDDLRAHALRGVIHRARGDAAEALADFDRAIALAPRNRDLRITRVNLRIGRHELEGTIEDAQVAIELDGAQPLPWAMLGWSRAARGELDEGLAAISRALELSPTHAYSLAARADVRRWKGDLEGAAADAERAVECGPDQGYPWAARADVRLARGDVQGALADTARALAYRALGEEQAARADILELERTLPPRSPLRALFAPR